LRWLPQFLIRVDEALDVFATHSIGGMTGNILTGLFAQKSVASLDGFSVINGGWIDRHWVQVSLDLNTGGILEGKGA